MIIYKFSITLQKYIHHILNNLISIVLKKKKIKDIINKVNFIHFNFRV